MAKRTPTRAKASEKTLARMSLLVPRDLRVRLEQAAERDRRSLTGQTLVAIERGLQEIERAVA